MSKAKKPGDLLKHRLLRPTPKVSDSGDLGWDPTLCMSNKSLGDAPNAGYGPHFVNHTIRFANGFVIYDSEDPPNYGASAWVLICTSVPY